ERRLIDGVLRTAQEAAQHRLEEGEGQRFAFGVECGAVVACAELFGPCEAGGIAKALAEVAVHAEMVEEIVALEDAVLFDHPEVLGGDERLQDGGGDVGMIVSAQRVADVVQEGADDVFFVAAVAVGEGGGLERMSQAVDGEAAEIAVKELE